MHSDSGLSLGTPCTKVHLGGLCGRTVNSRPAQWTSSPATRGSMDYLYFWVLENRDAMRYSAQKTNP